MSNKKLTQIQRFVLANLNDGEWRSAYELQVSRATLRALMTRGLVQSRGAGGLNALLSPRTTIEYRLIPPHPDEEPK